MEGDGYKILNYRLSCVRPTATHECGTWTLNKNSTKRINNCISKQVLHKSTTIVVFSVTLVYTSCGRAQNQHIQALHLGFYIICLIEVESYFGHGKRHRSQERRAVEGKAEGNGSRGRGRGRWDKDVMEEWGRRTSGAWEA